MGRRPTAMGGFRSEGSRRGEPLSGDRTPPTRVEALLDRLTSDDRASYRQSSTASELAVLREDDLAVLLTDRFQTARRAPGSAPEVRLATTAPVPLTPTVGRNTASLRS